MGRQRSGDIQNQSLKESLPLGLNKDYMRSHPQNAQQDARHMARSQRLNATTIIFIG